MNRWILGLFLITTSLGSTLFGAQKYAVDTVHSSVLFKVKRFDVANFYGRFNGLTGTISHDAENPANSSVEFEIKADAVDTDNDRRDDHLRSPDFFDAKQFPVITFKSTGVKPTSENRLEVTGDLTMHGVTRSIVADVEVVGTGQHPRQGTPIIGFETRFTVKRSDFGINYMLGPLSDEIQIILAVQGQAAE